MSRFEKAPDDVKERAEALIEKFHPDLHAQDVEIAYVFAHGKRDKDGALVGAALRLHGNQCSGIARILGGKDRALRKVDVEISLDADRWPSMPDKQKDALLDHELQHFEVKRNGKGEVVYDEYDRPRIGLRKHDYDFGWFTCIAIRHGADSFECQQAALIFNENGQFYFRFVDMEGKLKETEPFAQPSIADSDSVPLSEEDEELVQKCLTAIRAEGKASIGPIQRKLKLGYTAVKRAMDVLVARGFLAEDHTGNAVHTYEILNVSVAADKFHQTMRKVLEPGGSVSSVTISGGGQSVTIKGNGKKKPSHKK